MSDPLQWLLKGNARERLAEYALNTSEFVDSTILFSYFLSRGLLRLTKKLLKTDHRQLKKTIQLAGNELWALLIITNLYHIAAFQKPVLEKNFKKHPNKRPLLLVHGIWHNNSAFFLLKRFLQKKGWNYIFYIDLHTSRFTIPELAQQLQDYIELIMKETGKKYIDLIAHSLGGIVSRYYIQFLGGNKKVKNLVTLGTPHRGTSLSFLGLHDSMRALRPRGHFMDKLNSMKLPTGVQYTSIWSPFDFMILPPENAKLLQEQAMNPSNVKNIATNSIGHGGFLVSKKMFKTISNILHK